MFRALALSCLLATPALAQGWEGRGLEDGVWFIGSAIPPDGAFLFQCGGRSAQNLPFEQSDITEPKLTRPGQIMLSVEPALFAPAPDSVTGLSIVVDGTPFVLPPLRFSEFDGFYEVPLDINEPIFARLRAGTTAALDWNGNRIADDISLQGSATAIRTMTRACTAGWAALPRTVQNWNVETVTAEAARYCQGPAVVEMTYARIHDLDGDNHPDLILDMGAVTCTDADSWMQRGAGMCGASHCSNFVYLSRGLSDEPEEILAIGTRITATETGQVRINAGAGLSTCAAEGFEACECQFDPTSGTLEFLGFVPYDPT